jgi:hypothetical protein
MIGYVSRPKMADYLAAAAAAGGGRQTGGSSPFKFPRYKGRSYSIKGGRKRRRRKKKGGRKKRKKKMTGKGLLNLLRMTYPWLKKIPNFFRSSTAKKLAGTLATSGATAGLNIALDKLKNRTVPLKTAAESRVRESAANLLEKARDKVRGGGGRRKKRRKGCCKKKKRLTGGRRRRGKRKSIKGQRKGNNVLVKSRTSGRRLRRSERRIPDIFD